VIELIVGAVIAVAAVVLVSLPFLRGSGDDVETSTELQDRRLMLIDERDRTLAALKELEFDHRTGKIDDTDYRELVGPLRRTAAEVIQALDAEE
jgi:hypothetical protein